MKRRLIWVCPVGNAFLLGCSALLLGLLTSQAQAQLESGPAAGSVPEPLKVFVATGDDAGKEIDCQAKLKQGPALVVFVQAETFDRPIARFIKGLDQGLGKDRNDVPAMVVWLTGDVDAGKSYLPKVQQSLQLTQTVWAVFPGDKSGPDGWGIDPDAHITAVVIEDGKVTGSYGDRSVNETVVPKVLKQFKPKP